MSGESFENTDLEIEQETGSLPEDVGTVVDEDENVIECSAPLQSGENYCPGEGRDMGKMIGCKCDEL